MDSPPSTVPKKYKPEQIVTLRGRLQSKTRMGVRSVEDLKLGLSQREAVLILYAVTAAFGFLNLILMERRATIALVLAVMGIGVFVGVQQLRYQEFAEILSVIQRATRRREILANHVAIRHVVESLNECHEFRSICDVLKQTLQRIGFDGIRLQFQAQFPRWFAPLTV